MNTRNWLGSALAAVLALGLAACGAQGSKDAGPATVQNTNTEAVSVSFDCVPPAKVWVDGVEKGATPTEIALVPGAYEVTFQRPGFAPDSQRVTVSAPTTVEGSLALLREGDSEALAALAASLDVDIETLGDVPVHRGSSEHLAVLYWPREDVRMEGLSTFRVDVGDDYAGDGVLRFVSKGDTLYEEPFDPANATTIAEIPQQVLDALKVNSKVKWGIFFEDKRKSDVTAEFKVVRKDKVAKQLEKLLSSKHFRRQDPVVQSMMQAEILLNNQLYTEALQFYLGALQTWPQSTQPYHGIVKSAMRMDLKETPVYATALQYYRGKGNQAGVKSTGLGIDSIPAPLQLKTPLANLSGRTSGGSAAPKPMGPGGAGVTPGAGSTGPGGVAGPATETVPQGNQGLQLAELAQQRANEAKQRFEDASNAVAAAQQTYDQTQAAADQARAAAQESGDQLRQLEEALAAVQDSDPDAAQKRDDLGKQIARLAQQTKELADQAQDLQQQANDTLAALERAKAEAAAVEEEAKVLAEQAERAKAQAGLPTEPVQPNVPVFDPLAAKAAVDEAQKVWQEAEARVETARQGLEQAEQIMEAAKAAAEANPSDPTLQAELSRAIQAYEQARQNLPQAEAEAQQAQQAYAQAVQQASQNK